MEFPFVGRGRELEGLRRLNEVQQHLPIFVYGPEGCGKTRLFREAASRFRRWFPDGVALLVRDWSREASSGPLPALVELAFRLYGVLDPTAYGTAARDGVVRELARWLGGKLGDWWLARFGPRRILVAVDEVVQPVGLQNVERYAKEMESRMNVFRPKALQGKILNLFALTSEGASWELLSRHTYLRRKYLWNMSRPDFEELYERAKELYRPANPPPFDEVWRICGGNPRCLKDVAELGFDVEAYMRWLLKPDFRVARAFAELEGMGRLDVLSAVVEDVDVLWRAGLDVEAVFVRHNLAMIVPRDEDPRYSPAIGGAEPPVDSEIGVGRIYAWQLPAYREAFRRLLAERQ